MKTEIQTKKRKPTPRDEDGNMIFPKYDYNWLDTRSWMGVYIFHEWKEEFKSYFEIIDLHSKKELEEKTAELEQKKIVVHRLFPFPEKPETKDFQEAHWMRACAYNFFKEVFKFRYEHDGGVNEWDIWQVILRKKQFLEIQKLINENSLQKFGDLIFYIIAKIQQTYVDEVEFYERPEMVKQMNNIGKEVDKLINVIDRISPDDHKRKYEDRQPELQNISFVFPDILPVKIEDPWLNRSIIDAVKKEYGDRAYKNWRKDLKRYATIHNEDIEKQNFKYHVAIALHNFFKTLNLFPIKKGSASNNKELLCIAKILEHGLIKVGNEGISDAQKIKNIRNWIKPQRHELKTYPTHVELPLNMEMLEKYFDKNFLHCVPQVKSMEKVGDAFYIAERFELQHLLKEICHIMDCVKQRKSQIGWQFSTLDQHEKKNPHLGTFHDLVHGVSDKKKKKKLVELTFQLEGSEAPQAIKERLPLLLVERAIAEYYENHQEEFDIDILAMEIIDNPDFSGYQTKCLHHYREQQERFLPQFCKNFYKFLLTEAPPTEMDYSATDKYSAILAVLLQKCWVFNQVRDEEYFIQQKVKQWLQDAKENP